MTLDEFKELNKSIGNHWFSDGAMRFFNSKIHDFDCISGVFISSEQRDGDKRRYTLRLADFQTGRVSTIGQFQEYATKGQALKAYRHAILYPSARSA